MKLWWPCANMAILYSDRAQNLIYACFHLKNFFTIYYWFSNELSATTLNEGIFPLCTSQPLCLATLDSTSAPCLGAILNSEITNRRHKNVENVALNRHRKGHLFTVWELKQEGRVLPCLTSAGNVCGGWLRFFPSLCTSTSDCGDVAGLIWGLQVNFDK